MNNANKLKTWSIGYAFVLPALIYMLLLVGYPIIDNIRLGFLNVDMSNFIQSDHQFVGFQNYIELFQDGTIIRALFNTVVYTVLCIILQFVIGISLALFFNQKFALASRLRGLVMISWLIPATITAMVFKYMFALDGGIINNALMSLHLIDAPIGWLVQSNMAMLSLVIANTWIGIPFNMILLTTGLTTIPKDIYESAAIDGANAIQRFFRLTLPLLRPAILSLLVLGFIYTFKVFELVVIMTNGGPVNATEMMSTFAYKMSFNQFQFSQGAAVANIMFIVLLIVGFWYFRVVHKEEAN
ncbi:sugar ABC transporter permease [Paenibacillus campi]|uniref:carbohydrate ABC transporter permease n=1 Tax=Paenibacillus campi TaxID=3106031 RepID=UPI002AFDF6CE|nr:sugar ABC transporter permease [Paenibacillus sp. SGZ-1009]